MGFGATDVNWAFSPTDRDGGQFDFIGAAEHEIAEILGRVDLIEDGATFSPLDLFRYAAENVRQLTAGGPSYFSVDSGATDLADFHNYQGGNDGADLGDWAASAGDDSYSAYDPYYVETPVTPADIQVMELIGYQLSSDPTIISGQTFENAAGVSIDYLLVSSCGVLLVDSGGVASGGTIDGYAVIDGAVSGATVPNRAGSSSYPRAAARPTYRLPRAAP